MTGATSNHRSNHRAGLTGMMTPVLVLSGVALVLGGWNLAAQGPVGPDLALTRLFQSVLGAQPGWAETLTASAKAPGLWATLSVGVLLAILRGQLRFGLAVPLAYGLAWLADKGLRALIHSPKPEADLVAVASVSTASGLPSTFGLVYGAVFGAALLAPGGALSLRTPALIAGAFILSGLTARLVLGGHWASQLVASAALGMVLAALALGAVLSLPVAGRR